MITHIQTDNTENSDQKTEVPNKDLRKYNKGLRPLPSNCNTKKHEVIKGVTNTPDSRKISL
jgi:hypothetical protein